MRNIFWFLVEAVWYMPRFYVLMLRRLWYHRDKHSEKHWWHKGKMHAYKRAYDELLELKNAIELEHYGNMRFGHTVKDEAGDVACFMLFAASIPNKRIKREW